MAHACSRRCNRNWERVGHWRQNFARHSWTTRSRSRFDAHEKYASSRLVVRVSTAREGKAAELDNLAFFAAAFSRKASRSFDGRAHDTTILIFFRIIFTISVHDLRPRSPASLFQCGLRKRTDGETLVNDTKGYFLAAGSYCFS